MTKYTIKGACHCHSKHKCRKERGSAPCRLLVCITRCALKALWRGFRVLGLIGFGIEDFRVWCRNVVVLPEENFDIFQGFAGVRTILSFWMESLLKGKDEVTVDYVDEPNIYNKCHSNC